MIEKYLLPVLRSFLDEPLLALVPAMVYAVCHVILRYRNGSRAARITTLAAAVLWTLFAAHEWSISRMPSPPNIRVDLLLSFPVLGIISAAGSIMFSWSLVAKPTAP
jgi:hypothetical protein